ncbi:MAG: ArsR/SmtB family transcription factor [Chloroflexota bacterium]
MTSNLPALAARKAPLARHEALAAFFQGLADPTRVRILDLLAERPRTVTELTEELGVAQGRVSSHLACLRWCGYVLATVDGRFNRYQLVDDRVRSLLADAESVVRENEERLNSCLVLATEPGDAAPIEALD